MYPVDIWRSYVSWKYVTKHTGIFGFLGHMRCKATIYGCISRGKWGTRRLTDFTSNFRGTGDHPTSLSPNLMISVISLFGYLQLSITIQISERQDTNPVIGFVSIHSFLVFPHCGLNFFTTHQKVPVYFLFSQIHWVLLTRIISVWPESVS